jgi:hypothetical protein
MRWVLSKAPECFQGPTLDEDDLGTIKIALASAASETLDFWGRTHGSEGTKNIYDRALDRVLAMEEAEIALDEQPDLVTGRIAADPLFGGPSATSSSWFGSVFNHLFLWL